MTEHQGKVKTCPHYGRVNMAFPKGLNQHTQYGSQLLIREEARHWLLTAGKLGTAPLTPAGIVALSDAERQHLAQLFGGGPLTTLDLIDLEHGPKE